VASLAAQLRELREKAGRPSYRELARRAFYSHSALSQAAAGQELPSLTVTLAFAEACGGDRQEWTVRWHQAAAAMQAGDVAPDVPVAADGAVSGPVRRGTRGWLDWSGRTRWERLALVGMAAVLLYWVTTQGRAAQPAPKPASALPALVSDGADPSAENCDLGAQTLDSSPVRAASGVLWGTLGLRYSPQCHAVWTRFDPAPALSRTGAVTLTIAVVRRSDGRIIVNHFWYTGGRQRGEVLLLRSGCAQGEITITEPGHAPVSATTTCQPPP
jgi:hypothetical protein